jgi:hypothetical protein
MEKAGQVKKKARVTGNESQERIHLAVEIQILYEARGVVWADRQHL